ncbi:protein inturned-like [Clavelina lepadiformis]|uniref:protein inturned-like n=1 Tax=Clavelina lepadiformis TaxID=159417 RepID=UPI0040428DAC
MADASAQQNRAFLYTQMQRNRGLKAARQFALEEYEGSDNSDDSYSDSEYTTSSGDSNPWEGEDLNAGELLYEDEPEVDSDKEVPKLNEHREDPSDENVKTYKNARPKPLTATGTSSLKVVEVRVNAALSYSGRQISLSHNLLASMLGIVMVDTSGKGKKNEKVVVDLLIPGGVALRSGQINLGDVLIAINDVCVTARNIEKFLKSIIRPMVLKITLQTFSDKPMLQNKLPFQSKPPSVTARECEVKVLNPHPGRLKQLYSLPGPHGVFFLTLNLRSETASEDDDLLYSYPHSGLLHETPSKLSQLRGIFVTLADVMKQMQSSEVLSTTLIINGQLVHCAYHQVKTEVFVICVPDVAYSLPQVHKTVSAAVRLLNIMYGSLLSAFQPENKHRLDQIFQHLLLVNSSAVEVTKKLPASTSYKIPSVRKLKLPTDLQGNVDAALAELEASDFDDGTKAVNFTRRLYTVRGSCIFYDGYLLANHLPEDDLYDVFLYCYNSGLLGIREKERSGLLLNWREVFCWKNRFESAEKNIYKEPSGRYFWLIIGLKRSILCVLLKLNGNLFPSSHTPRPDSNYVNYAKAALMNLDSCNFYDYVQQRLSTISTPYLVPAGDYLSKQSSFFKSNKPPSGQGSTPGKGFKLNFNSPLKLKSATSDSDDGRRASPSRLSQSSAGKSPVASSAVEAQTPKSSVKRLFREKSFSSQGSSESMGSGKTTKRKGTNLGMENVQNALTTVGDEHCYTQLTAGNENSLFCYLDLDPLRGVFITPTEFDLSAVDSESHQAIVTSFKKYALILHQRMSRKNPNGDYCIEEGILFKFQSSKHQQKKNSPYLQYWIVGRAMRSPVEKEFYVCFHNSAPQTMVELAFKSGFEF